VDERGEVKKERPPSRNGGTERAAYKKVRVTFHLEGRDMQLPNIPQVKRKRGTAHRVVLRKRFVRTRRRGGKGWSLCYPAKGIGETTGDIMRFGGLKRDRGRSRENECG